MKEFMSAVEDSLNEGDEGQYIEFKVDGRTLRSYTPHEGQLTFMLAAMGRGQTTDAKFASIINLMMSTLRGDDADYLQDRLLERDPAKRLSVKTIESIFEYLVAEWFARPTQPSSDSAPSPQSDGPNSTPPITK